MKKQSPRPVCKQWYQKYAQDLLLDDEALASVEPPKRKKTRPDHDTDTCDGPESSDDGNKKQGSATEKEGHSADTDVSDDDVEDDDEVEDEHGTRKSFKNRSFTRKDGEGPSAVDQIPKSSN